MCQGLIEKLLERYRNSDRFETIVEVEDLLLKSKNNTDA